MAGATSDASRQRRSLRVVAACRRAPERRAGARHRGRGEPGPPTSLDAARSPTLSCVDGSSTGTPTSSSHLGAGDHDLRARRRRERHRRRRRDARPTPTDRARRRTSWSSRRRWSTGRTPTTRCRSPRTPSCGPTSTFVYARQLATVEALVDDWRGARAGRTVTVLRPVDPMAADGTSSLARGARRRARPALRRGGSAGAVPAPRRPGQRRGAGRRARRSTACSTSRPTAASPASGCGR